VALTKKHEGINKMIKAIEATKTEQVIFDMLTENTGVHMMDSGGDDGRMWQRNAKKTLDDFRSEPFATIDPKYGDSSISLFHYMNQYLDFDEELTKHFEEFATQLPEEPWLEIIEEWLDVLSVESEGEFYSDARWNFNTYNFDLWWVNQTLQGSFFGMNGKDFLIVQVHGGADVRGGYTKPKVFALKSWSGKDEFVLSAADMCFTCPKCDATLNISGYDANFLNADGELKELDGIEEMPICECGGEWVA
jgi:hypothetical protein